MIDHLVKDFDENIKSLQNFFDLLSLFLDEHHKKSDVDHFKTLLISC